MKKARVAIAAVAVIALGAVAWWFRPGRECRRFAALMCAYSARTCRALEQAREKGLGEDRCREASATLQVLIEVPVEIGRPAIEEAFARAIGAERMHEADRDARPLLLTLDSDLASGLRSPVAMMDKLRALGPPACGELLAHFQRQGLDPQKKRILHQLLVELRGQDLGPDPAPWRVWCDDVFAENLAPR